VFGLQVGQPFSRDDVWGNDGRSNGRCASELRAQVIIQFTLNHTFATVRPAAWLARCRSPGAGLVHLSIWLNAAAPIPHGRTKTRQSTVLQSTAAILHRRHAAWLPQTRCEWLRVESSLGRLAFAVRVWLPVESDPSLCQCASKMQGLPDAMSFTALRATVH
jgi:hypothetical protein